MHLFGYHHTDTDGDVLLSQGEHFELGFFSPGSSSNRYVGSSNVSGSGQVMFQDPEMAGSLLRFWIRGILFCLRMNTAKRM